MASLQELVTIGERMGLQDKPLQDFVAHQQAVTRDEREKQRQVEREKVELEKEREINKKLELEIKQDQLKAQISGLGGAGGGTSTHENKARGPKMAPYDERDDMDAYIFRFERYAEMQEWAEDEWAIYLSALLRGRALEVYARLTAEESSDYKTLKAALLRRYQMTEEGYKRKFYNAKPDNGESPPQFVTRISKYLTRWIDLAEVEQTFDGVCSLFVREQFLSVCSKDLEMFLRERALTDLREVGKLAEQYEDAHVSGTKRRQPEVKTMERGESSEQPHKPVDQELKRKTCFTCGKVGHIARNCFNKAKVGALSQNLNPGRTWQNRSSNWGWQTRDNGIGTEAGENNRTTNSNGLGSLRCKAHKRQNCMDCLESTTEPSGHHCGAMLSEEVTLECGCTIPVVADACNTKLGIRENMPVVEGWIGGQSVNVLRDTGCSAVVVRRSLVEDSQLTGHTRLCILIDGTVRRVPTEKIAVDTPFYKGTVEALCMKCPLYDLILGNIPGIKANPTPNTSDGKMEQREQLHSERESDELQAVETRAQAAKPKGDKPLQVADIMVSEVSSTDLIAWQREDSTLQVLWQKCTDGEAQSDGKGTTSLEVKRELLYRRRMTAECESSLQLVVPARLRETVLKLGHDSIMSGHQGIKKTYERVAAHFFWPGIHADVVRYCRSCDICQRTVAKGRVANVLLGHMPLIETPFQRVAVDLVGPIAPATDRGNRYILTLVDYATRYPEASALKNIEAETVAEAIVTMFTRVGIPSEILSDQGSQFMSAVMKETSRLLSMTQLITTPYHPMCNGLVERFNGTLKSMLRKMCVERPKDWDRYLPALLFAYREAPQESLAFSPFELLYGRTVRGPMAILKEIWSREETKPEVKLTYQYVMDLQSRLQETCEMARDALSKAQVKQKRYFDTKAKDRQFQKGDKVLLLLPTDGNKLLTQWKGPFEVVERQNGNNYRIQLPGRVRLFHANMLKQYTTRETAAAAQIEQIAAAILECDDTDCEMMTELSMKRKETYADVHVNPELEMAQKQQAKELITEFEDIFTDVPRTTTLGDHSISLTTTDPIRSKAYPLPYAMREVVDKELESMLNMGIVEPSTAFYASPIVLVRKSDGSNRVCVDYRKLNKVTCFDPEPMPKMEEIFAELVGSKFLSKFDFSKGYWQIPMKFEDRDITTFITHRGLFRFKVMPFGLVNAPATFSRLMRKLLDQLKNLRNYLDDVLAHTSGWVEHVSVLREFFGRVRAANLVLRPTKCFVGFFSLTFLGHQVGSHELGPTCEMLDKIERAPCPTTKTQLRSFLGLVGYYRAFVPNFAAIAVPLTDLTKKGAPNQLAWGEAQQKAYTSLKQHVCTKPILQLPDLQKPFLLQTDASNDGIGAILLQEEAGVKHPVAFASKKLLPRERNYSTIEKEALAIVWGVQKFQNFLYGQTFVLETDHQPLQYLNSAKFQNGRVMRWALALQPYRFTLRAIKGSQNVGADFLSRHAC